jgi:crossover junction endodeoxyribonuclease RuvC
MRVLGVDPGSAVTGYGVVDGQAGRFSHVASGTVRPAAAERGPGRLKTIHDGLLSVIDAFAPEVMSLERSFVAANVQSAFRLGEARAAAMLAAADRGLGFFEYPPNQVKLAVAAFGHADKAQVKSMIRRTLGLDEALALADDAADALALAICHLSRSRLQALEDAPRPRRRRMPARWSRS